MNTKIWIELHLIESRKDVGKFTRLAWCLYFLSPLLAMKSVYPFLFFLSSSCSCHKKKKKSRCLLRENIKKSKMSL